MHAARAAAPRVLELVGEAWTLVSTPRRLVIGAALPQLGEVFAPVHPSSREESSDIERAAAHKPDPKFPSRMDYRF